MLEMRLRKGSCAFMGDEGWIWCPELICDTCGKKIENLDSGLLLWKQGAEDIKNKRVTELRMVHKGACDNQKDIYSASMELSTILEWLTMNHKVKGWIAGSKR